MTPPNPQAPHAHAELCCHLAQIVLADQPLSATLSRILDLMVAEIPGAEEISVSLLTRGKAQTVAFSSSSRHATALDERQYGEGAGPCLDAALTEREISIPDTAHESVYPELARQAHRAGICRILCIPVVPPHNVRGALNLYGGGPKPFSERDRRAARTFAEHAAIAMVNAALYAQARDEVTQMHTAMASRAVIEQAKGAIMSLRTCTAEEAFDVLKTSSSHRNRKLRDIAREIVETVSTRS